MMRIALHWSSSFDSLAHQHIASHIFPLLFSKFNKDFFVYLEKLYISYMLTAYPLFSLKPLILVGLEAILKILSGIFVGSI